MNEAEAVVLSEIRRILRDEIACTTTARTDHRLVEDLGLDSLGLTVLAVGLENRFRIRLFVDDSSTVRTVADLARLVATRAGETTPLGGESG